MKWGFLTMNFMLSFHRTTKNLALNIHQKTGQAPCSVAVLAIDFLTILCSIDDITGCTEK